MERYDAKTIKEMNKGVTCFTIEMDRAQDIIQKRAREWYNIIVLYMPSKSLTDELEKMWYKIECDDNTLWYTQVSRAD